MNEGATTGPSPEFEVLAQPAPGNPSHLAIPVHNLTEGKYVFSYNCYIVADIYDIIKQTAILMDSNRNFYFYIQLAR